MPTYSDSALRRALRAAGAGAPLRARPTPTNSDLAMQQVVAGWMKKSGFSARALGALKKQHRAEFDRAVEEQRIKDRKNTNRRDPSHAAVAAQARGLQLVADNNSFFPHP